MSGVLQAERGPPPAVRTALVAVPLVVILASVVLAVASAAAWGAADQYGYPSWLPTSAGVIWGILSGLMCLRLVLSVLRVTGESITFDPALVIFGIASMLVVLLLEVVLTAKVDDASMYKTWSEKKLSTDAVLVGAGVVIVLLSLVLFLGAGSFRTGLQSDKGRRFDKDTAEPDAIGSLIAEDQETDSSEGLER